MEGWGGRSLRVLRVSELGGGGRGGHTGVPWPQKWACPVEQLLGQSGLLLESLIPDPSHMGPAGLGAGSWEALTLRWNPSVRGHLGLL